MKTYINKDFIVYKCLADTIDDWQTVHIFKRVLFNKFSELSDYDLYIKYGILQENFILSYYLSYNTWMVIVNSEHYIIPKSRLDIIDFCKKNMPKELFEFKTTRLIGLNASLQYRDRFNSDFKNQMSFYSKTRHAYYTIGSKKESEYIKSLDGYYEHICKLRKEKINKILSNV